MPLLAINHFRPLRYLRGSSVVKAQAAHTSFHAGDVTVIPCHPEGRAFCGPKDLNLSLPLALSFVYAAPDANGATPLAVPSSTLASTRSSIFDFLFSIFDFRFSRSNP